MKKVHVRQLLPDGCRCFLVWGHNSIKPKLNLALAGHKMLTRSNLDFDRLQNIFTHRYLRLPLGLMTLYVMKGSCRVHDVVSSCHQA